MGWSLEWTWTGITWTYKCNLKIVACILKGRKFATAPSCFQRSNPFDMSGAVTPNASIPLPPKKMQPFCVVLVMRMRRSPGSIISFSVQGTSSILIIKESFLDYLITTLLYVYVCKLVKPWICAGLAHLSGQASSAEREHLSLSMINSQLYIRTVPRYTFQNTFQPTLVFFYFSLRVLKVLLGRKHEKFEKLFSSI